MLHKKEIKILARSLGADLIGFASAKKYHDYAREVAFRIKETGATESDFMLPNDATTYFNQLSDVHYSLPEAKSIILIGVYSFDTQGEYKATKKKLKGKIARTYAYYPVVRQIAEKVAEFIKNAGYNTIQGQQIPLKHAANDIGMGSYGWNGLLQTEKFGSYMALRAVITEAELDPDTFEPVSLECEDCGRCIKACPTGALYAPYKVNPSLCINPLTRRKDTFPNKLKKKINNWVCGCDICQEVCPSNRKLKPRIPDPRAGFDPGKHSSHRLLGGLDRCPDLEDILEKDHLPEMKRNAITALANIGTKRAIRILEYHKQNNTDNLATFIKQEIHRAYKNL